MLEIDLEYPKELCELCNVSFLAQGKTRNQKKNIDQISTKDSYNIIIGNVKKLVPNLKKVCASLCKLAT